MSEGGVGCLSGVRCMRELGGRRKERDGVAGLADREEVEARRCCYTNTMRKRLTSARSCDDSDSNRRSFHHWLLARN